MEPPLVLVLAKSSKRGLFIQTQLDGTGVTTASLLNWDELELRARAWSHLAKPITNPYDIHRTTEQGDWRAEVEQLIDLVPIVILDFRELSPAVLWEADALLRPERSKKALFIVNDDRKSPVLEGFREILGPEVDTMGTRATEADVFGFFERVSRGLRHPVRLEMFLTSTEQFRMELDLSQRLRGEDHPKTLALINTLAAAVAKEGNVAEGISLLRRALNLRERVHGSEHPNTVATAHNLAWLLLTKGDLAAADVLYRRVLASKERDGTEIDFAIILNNHALLLRKLSRFDEAAEQLRRAIAIEDRLLPTGHPNRAHRRNNLAIVLMLAGQTDDAAEANVEASELNARYVESEHDMTSVRILVIRVVLQWLQGSDAAVALGQIQLLLEQPELPCHGRIDANWKVEDVIEHLRAKLSTQQVRLLVSIVESLNASKASQ
jgi:tetratricopeptide (TPR) repeat protein